MIQFTLVALILKTVSLYCPWKEIFLGDVVAQLAKATGRHQTEDVAVPGSNPAPLTVS
jgi:hypothetical protein